MTTRVPRAIRWAEGVKGGNTRSVRIACVDACWNTTTKDQLDWAKTEQTSRNDIARGIAKALKTIGPPGRTAAVHSSHGKQTTATQLPQHATSHPRNRQHFQLTLALLPNPRRRPIGSAEFGPAHAFPAGQADSQQQTVVHQPVLRQPLRVQPQLPQDGFPATGAQGHIQDTHAAEGLQVEVLEADFDAALALQQGALRVPQIVKLLPVLHLESAAAGQGTLEVELEVQGEGLGRGGLSRMEERIADAKGT